MLSLLSHTQHPFLFSCFICCFCCCFFFFLLIFLLYSNVDRWSVVDGILWVVIQQYYYYYYVLFLYVHVRHDCVETYQRIRYSNIHALLLWIYMYISVIIHNCCCICISRHILKNIFHQFSPVLPFTKWISSHILTIIKFYYRYLSAYIYIFYPLPFGAETEAKASQGRVYLILWLSTKKFFPCLYLIPFCFVVLQGLWGVIAVEAEIFQCVMVYNNDECSIFQDTSEGAGQTNKWEKKKI